MQEINFLESLHTSTKRNYLERACLPDRAECMRIASQYGKDYWDGDRKYGYGGYKYDGRWKNTAEIFIKYYSLRLNSRILDIGCGKGFLLYELNKIIDTDVNGLDISRYAIEKSRNIIGEKKTASGYISSLQIGTCGEPFIWASNLFDFVYSINVLHNLNYTDLKLAIREIVRVMKDKAWICVESFRNEEEKCNLLNWALTCQSYYSPDDWKNILTDNGYKCDVGFVFFE